ncbi:MAG TPA: PP2C family serine/threonine-protein phosphatase [Actinomycetota bacterium]|nr:PP2C family serine/threonine-protein phosphatase [Actinomycetota bacterium]
MSQPSFLTGSWSETGTVRTNNEDAMAATARLLAVADGVGGRPAGEVASAVAVAVLRASFERGVGIEEAVQAAHEVVQTASRCNSLLHTMVTTLTAAAIQDGSIVLAHIGDTRAYLLSGGELQPLTTDQTAEAKLIAEGKADEAAKLRNPKALAQVVGGRQERLEPVVSKVEMGPGDRLFLCTDGVSGYLSDGDMGRLLSETQDVQAAAEAVCKAALEAGSNDNVTAVVADLSG